MKMQKLVLENFKSFRGKHTLEFPDQAPGLYFLIGDNKAEPSLGANGCLIGSTEVDVPRDLSGSTRGIPIRELIGKTFHVFCYDKINNCFTLKRAKDVRKTGIRKPVYKLSYEGKDYKHFHSYDYIIGTYDHPILKTDGSYCKLGELKRGDSLRSLYRKTYDGYVHLVLNDSKCKSKYEHKFIGELVCGQYDVHHHKNHKKWDNSIENLEGLSSVEHQSLHAYKNHEKENFMWNIHPKGMKGKKHSSTTKAKISSTIKYQWKEDRQRRVLAIKNAGIAKRNKSGKKINNKAWLENIYKSGATGKEIAKICECSTQTVYNRLSDFGVVIRKTNHKVISVEFYGYEDVYDMEVEDCHNFVANGIVVHNSGKSTIWDGLFWIIYGKTLRNLKAGDVCTWGVKGRCAGHLFFERSGEEHVLIRTWNPNNLELDGETVDQQVVEDLIGLNSESFQHSIITGQFSPMFFDLKPAQKLSLFSDMFELDFWLDKSQEATQWTTEIAGKISSCESDIATLEGNITLTETNLENYYDSNEGYLKTERERVKVLKNVLKDHKNKLEEKKGKGCSHNKEMKTVEDDLAEFDLAVKEVQDNLDEENTSRGFVEQKITRLETKIDASRKEWKKLDGVGNTCPHCGQKVSAKHLRDEKKRIESEGNKLKDKLSDENEDLEHIQKQLKELKEEKKDLQNDRMKVDNKIRELILEKRTYENELNNLSEKVDDAQEDLDQVLEEKNPHKDLIATAEEQLIGFEKELELLVLHLDDLLTKHECNKYWIKGFKEVRLFMIEEALNQLEVEVSNSLMQLGLHNWEIAFDVERETKSGSITKGFTVFIKSPYNEDLVPWEAWSGGESQRLRLAGTMGLANLILGKSGIKSNIEVFDEPTQHLNPEGVEDLLELLQSRAEELKRQVWVVEHHSLDYGGFQQVIRVTKTVEGSSIEILEDY
ncbi:hypothetical protein LCGC14_0231820 [marine sediment metagenome]|uniref:Hint domain-containing protein n=1 Tax=marine sediment metagenome TaxID=412755 RepID=A0A0F9UEH8_9ZZZZ